MKITEVLFKIAKRTPGGHLWRGKYRLYKKITPEILTRKHADLEREEENMFYLRNPYLTYEQAKGHAVTFKHHEKFLQKKIEMKINDWRKHSYLGDRFGFLKVSDKWE